MYHGWDGSGIGIAFLDTGIYPHRDFGDRIIHFVDFLSERQMPYDDNGHGTHTAGIACGDGTASGFTICGVAPKAQVIALKVLDHYGNGKKAGVMQALDWIKTYHKRYRIRIVNISVGSANSNRHVQAELIDAVEQIWDLGLVVVTAAGNLGPQAGSVTAPGSSRKVITVGASDLLTSLYPISGRGPTSSCICKPDIVTPGLGILACAAGQDQYVKKSGTSMSTASVSGACALLLQKYPSMDNLTVKKRILESGKDLGFPRNMQGRGLLDIEQLLDFG